MRLEVNVNGVRHVTTVEPRKLLIDWLREDLGLMGAKVGCDDGSCGACTVLIDSRPATPCMLLAAQADGTKVETIEGLRDDPLVLRAQQVLMKHHAVQCGYCAPAIVVTLVAARRQGIKPEEISVREHLAGNLCRCTGYTGIVLAAMEFLA